jgi:hypothetical protein
MSCRIAADTHRTADAVAAYIDAHLFAPDGLMYSGIDSHTGRPFDRDLITPAKVPRRAAEDPWSYWTYEDSVMSMGLYVEAQVHRHACGDAGALDRARAVAETIRKVYYASQVHGSKITSPSDGVTYPRTVFSVVLLPLALPPNRQTISPGKICMSTSRSTATSP